MFLVKALWVFGLWQGLPPLLVEAVDHDPLRSRIQDLRSDAERLEAHTPCDTGGITSIPRTLKTK